MGQLGAVITLSDVDLLWVTEPIPEDSQQVAHPGPALCCGSMEPISCGEGGGATQGNGVKMYKLSGIK